MKTHKNLIYEVVNNEVTILGFVEGKETKTLDITEIQGLPVKTIGDRAFWDNNITNLNLPNVKTIGNRAFRGNKLTNLNLPNVKIIENDAFRNNNITNLNLPKVKTIENDVFAYNNLTSVNLPKVKTIGDSAFWNNKLTSVNLPKVKTIRGFAFWNNKLTSVNLPKVETIKKYAFWDNNLTSATIRGKKYKVIMVDNDPLLINSEKKVGEFTVYDCQYLSTHQVYVAEKGKYQAHGETIKEAIEDVNYKYLQATVNISKLVVKIKKANKVTATDYRLLTGACRFGIKKFKEDNGIKKDYLTIKQMLKLTTNEYGGERMEELFN